MKSRNVDKQQVNVYLKQIGMTIGNWNDLQEVPGRTEMVWVNYKSPDKAKTLFTFSQHVANWLPLGEWSLFQIDDSTELRADQADWLAKSLNLKSTIPSWNKLLRSSVLFELEVGDEWASAITMVLSQLIFMSLLFEWHVYIVSARRPLGEYLNLHDGFTYFHGEKESIVSAKQLITEFEQQPNRTAPWVASLISAEQDLV